MPTRNVVLTDHQAALIERLVASGRYQNASEVLREGLRVIEQREATYEAKLAGFRAAIQVGEDDIAAGRYKEFSSAAELRDYLKGIADEVIRRSRR